ncbi:MAG: GNAT family N-acetyltransferase [Clostridia bacterium]|nr:GNAT family N-acetyltransferase [Clostridia bacterium]
MKKILSKIDNHCISLRFIETDDAAFLMELNNNLEIAKCVVGNPRQVTLQEQMCWMKKVATEEKTKRFIIEYDGEPVGTVIISSIDLSNLTANVNIKLHSSARGKGIGKRSIKLALEYCFDVLRIYCVTAHVLSFNKASLALFESCGFIKEGVLRSRVIKNNERCDLISFSITREDFNN